MCQAVRRGGVRSGMWRSVWRFWLGLDRCARRHGVAVVGGRGAVSGVCVGGKAVELWKGA